MSCRDARQIVEAISVHNDRLIALDCVKRWFWLKRFQEKFMQAQRWTEMEAAALIYVNHYECQSHLRKFEDKVVLY